MVRILRSCRLNRNCPTQAEFALLNLNHNHTAFSFNHYWYWHFRAQ
ncbi:MAG: hypothetical protein ABIL39_06470 [candidate division WOR-3 bacterium]